MFSEKFIRRLLKTPTITILTGAGVSAESGVPTFRGKEGLWKDQDVAKLASQESLKDNPEQFWEFYNWRREKLKSVKPNLGHYALVDLEQRFAEFTLITQNVDNLHRVAGNKNIIELHGNIWQTRCNDCGHEVAYEQLVSDKEVPHCPKCSGLMRPGVVLFGESLPQKAIRAAQEAAATCEIIFSIGTSSLVEPAASLPYIAKGNGAYLIEINTERTPLSEHADEVVLGKAGKVLPFLVMLLERFN